LNKDNIDKEEVKKDSSRRGRPKGSRNQVKPEMPKAKSEGETDEVPEDEEDDNIITKTIVKSKTKLKKTPSE